MPADPTSMQRNAWVLLAIVAVVAVLHFAQEVLVPLALAILLTFLLAPVANRLQRLGLGRVPSVALTTVIACALAGALLLVVVNQFLGLVEDLPLYRDNLLAKIRAVSGSASGDLQLGAETVKELTEELQKGAPGRADSPDIAKVQVVEPPPNAMQVIRSVFGPLVAPVSTAAIVVVFVIFMLLQREDLRDRVVRLLGTHWMHTTVMALDDAAERVSRYLLMQTLINGVHGALVATGLFFIGVPEPMLWGALTLVLRFIPYLGPALAAAGPIVLSVAVFDNWTYPLLTVGWILMLELISNNALEPRLYGSSVGVSSLALLVATVFWTWLWGTVGLFLATPLTVCLVVMGKYIPQLEFLGVMLSDQPVLEPRERFYQRLLADDIEEAEELLDEALRNGSPVEVADSIVLPALRLAEQDHDRGALDEAKRRAVVDRIGELLDDLREARHSAGRTGDAASALPAGRPAPFTMLCLPAADHADELAAELFAALVTAPSVEARGVSVDTLKGEMLELIEQARPDLVCISAMPPAAVLHARYLCKRLRNRFPELPILVGLWDAQGDLQKSRDRLTSVGANEVVASAAAGIDKTTELLQPLIQGIQAPADAAREAVEPV